MTLTSVLPTGVFAVAHPPDGVVDAPEDAVEAQAGGVGSAVETFGSADEMFGAADETVGAAADDPAVSGVDEAADTQPERPRTPPPAPPFVPLKEAKQAPPPPAVVPVAATGVLDIPAVAVSAYRSSAEVLGAENPACGLPWTLLAGIGRIESGHAFGAPADGAGNPVQPIYGPVLDGSLDGNEIITDTDDGLLDGTTTHDRAVGPMQFIPETWQYYAADGNGDGVADPQNIFDAALAAGRYLCDGGSELDHHEQRERAILRYNNSMAYVVSVMAWEQAYREGIDPTQVS
ncbi:lytic transglycosylase domain-containing protein [Nocardia sp. NPDC051750]|uniref:lytic transglycosylase domain-containing protein n=1 Tax=Nocardia sp. NPDC051750 TaxID=3364325 RepID=UPI0037974D60